MYFDPGTGSLIIQAVIALLAVAGGYFAAMKLKVKNLFSKKKDQSDEADSHDDTL